MHLGPGILSPIQLHHVRIVERGMRHAHLSRLLAEVCLGDLHLPLLFRGGPGDHQGCEQGECGGGEEPGAAGAARVRTMPVVRKAGFHGPSMLLTKQRPLTVGGRAGGNCTTRLPLLAQCRRESGGLLSEAGDGPDVSAVADEAESESSAAWITWGNARRQLRNL